MATRRRLATCHGTWQVDRPQASAGRCAPCRTRAGRGRASWSRSTRSSSTCSRRGPRRPPPGARPASRSGAWRAAAAPPCGAWRAVAARLRIRSVAPLPGTPWCRGAPRCGSRRRSAGRRRGLGARARLVRHLVTLDRWTVARSRCRPPCCPPLRLGTRLVFQLHLAVALRERRSLGRHVMWVLASVVGPPPEHRPTELLARGDVPRGSCRARPRRAASCC